MKGGKYRVNSLVETKENGQKRRSEKEVGVGYRRDMDRGMDRGI